MPSITLEYMIMIPVLIAQIFIFPFTASVIMNTWTDSRMTIELQETAGHMGSSIQQLYYMMNHDAMSNGTISISLVYAAVDRRACLPNDSKTSATIGYFLPDNERHPQAFRH